MIIRSVLLCAVLVLAAGRARPEEEVKDWLCRATFDALDAAYRKTPASQAEDGTMLAWGRSYALSAYANMHRVTGDVSYLRRLLEEGEAIAALRDDRQKPAPRDTIRDRVMPAWSVSLYPKDGRYTRAVHTGMITAPILEGLWLARKTTESKGAFSPTRRAALQKAVREAVDSHADQWRKGPRAGEGHLYGLSLEEHLPLRMQNALGRSYIWLHRLTGEKEYARRARALLTFFKNRLSKEGEAWVWAQHPPLNGPGEGYARTSTAAISVDFACLGAERGWVFTAEDLQRLRRTLSDNVMGPKAPMDTVGGTWIHGHFAKQIGRWLPLTDGDADTWKRIRKWFDANRPAATSTGLLDVAQLLRFRPR